MKFFSRSFVSLTTMKQSPVQLYNLKFSEKLSYYIVAIPELHVLTHLWSKYLEQTGGPCVCAHLCYKRGRTGVHRSTGTRLVVHTTRCFISTPHTPVTLCDRVTLTAVGLPHCAVVQLHCYTETKNRYNTVKGWRSVLIYRPWIA